MYYTEEEWKEMCSKDPLLEKEYLAAKEKWNNEKKEKEKEYNLSIERQIKSKGVALL